MSLKRVVVAAMAALALIGGAGAAGMSAAGAASPSCGRTCIDLLSRLFGTRAKPTFLVDTFRRADNLGQPVILFRASNDDPAEDFTVSASGTVADFYAAGLVGAAVDLHYANDLAYEVQYAPYGVDSGLCAGVPAVAASNTKISLQPCGETAKTIWIVGSSGSIKTSYVPLINGSDTNFSRPFVLTYPVGANPAATPRLTTQPLATYSDGAVFTNQLWSADFGVLP
jgi:hypothetical protein